jgi:hypothetical protein
MNALIWRKRYMMTSTKPYWRADCADGSHYRLRAVPFKGWQAARQVLACCTMPGIVKTKAEAMAWCENDYAQRQMEVVGTA